MELKKKIEQDLKVAMLAKDTPRVTVLRGVKATILDAEVAMGKREEGLADAEIEKLLAKEVKRRKEAIAMYEENGRDDLVASERFEQEALEGYLPKQMGEDEIRAEIDEVLAELGEGANMGAVIGGVKSRAGGSADGAVIAKLVKEKLG